MIFMNMNYDIYLICYGFKMWRGIDLHSIAILNEVIWKILPIYDAYPKWINE